MFTINRNKIFYPLNLVLMISFLPIFSSADVHAEKTGEKWITKVALKKNARVNGFKIKVRGGVNYFEAVKVTDPTTKKLVEGEMEFEYRCMEGNLLTKVKLRFTNGNSTSIQIGCTNLINPKIIIMDEEEQLLPPQ